MAAFRDLEVGVMARRELHALRRHEVEEGIVQRRDNLPHRAHHALIGLRTRDGVHVGVGRRDGLGLRSHAARDDDLAVFRQGEADGVQRFPLGAVEEPAGVDDDGVRTGVVLGEFVALGAQLRDDPFAVDQRLGAAERHERDAGRRPVAGRRT